MAEKIKKFIDCYIPITTCNLRCHYCYVTLNREFDKEIFPLKYSPEHIGKAINKERFGGICCFNLCAKGETLMLPEISKLIYEMLNQGHYVMVVTNGTLTKVFDEILKIDSELLKRLFFKFSFQYLEFKRLNLFEKFFENIKKVDKAGCSYTLEITPNDELIPYIEDVKNMAINNIGAIPHVSVARDSRSEDLPILTKYSRKEYKKIWEVFNSKMFEYKLSVFNKKRKEFCYAGAWSYHLDLENGNLRQCYCGEILQNIFEDLNSNIVEKPIGYNCPEAHCYNAHAWLTWGDIPEHNAPTYLEMRERNTNNGMIWCKEPIKSFFKTKLKESNEEFSFYKKIKYSQKYKSIINNIFSVKNEYSKNIKRKVITILGLKIKIRKTRAI